MLTTGKRGRLSARTLICVFGAASIIWSVYATVSLVWPTSLDRTAKHIIQGDTFPGDTIISLAATLDDVKGDGEPGVLRSVALIRLRALEKSTADGGSPNLDEDQLKLDAAIRRSLAKAPTDPFLWVVLYWLENTRNGFSRDHLKFLRMSYALGPNEGWIAGSRNRQALAIFSQLSPDTQRQVIHEFAGLVQSDYIGQAADLLIGPGWQIREKLLSGLREVPLIQREGLARAVYGLGYDVSVPGVKSSAPRPWR